MNRSFISSSSSRSLLATSSSSTSSCVRCLIPARRFQSPYSIYTAAGPSRSFTSTVTRYSITKTDVNQGQEEVEVEVEVEQEEEKDSKINTWFLNPSPSTSSTIRQPVFTPYDPQSTLPLPSTQTSSSNTTVTPLSTNASVPLRKIHTFLTSSDSVASDVIHQDSINVFDTLLLNQSMQSYGQGEVIRAPPTESQSEVVEGDDDEIIPVEGVWRWIIVLQVKGRGKGVVARADGVIRRWLVQNPIGNSKSSFPRSTAAISNPKLPRIDPDADWSIVPLPREGICINLLTEEGRLHWRLEDVWQPRS